MTILIVDDNGADRTLLRLALERQAVTVDEAIDGVQALAMLRAGKFDAVISDVLMPRMDGYRLCREIRLDPRLGHLPVIAYTGVYLQAGDEQRALDHGVDRYLRKPASGEQLVGVLTGLLGPAAVPTKRVPAAEVPLDMQEYNSVLVKQLKEKGREIEEQNGQLLLANAQLRALAARHNTVREEERATIAREIHDVLAQDLTCLKIDLAWVARRATQPIDDPTRGAVAARIGDAIAQADAAITTVQRIATELRPVVLDSLGLAAAVEWQVEEFARRAGLLFQTRARLVPSRLSREGATAIFRILQESLTNIARHAQATAVEVDFHEGPAAATLVITDDGRGITDAEVAAARSIGLAGMRERAQAFGGTVAINGVAGAGTTVRVEFPLEPAPAGAAA